MKLILSLLAILLTIQLVAQVPPPSSVPPASASTTNSFAANTAKPKKKVTKDKKMSIGDILKANRAKLKNKAMAESNEDSSDDDKQARFKQFLTALENAQVNYEAENYPEAKAGLLQAYDLADLEDYDVALSLVEAFFDLGYELEDDELLEKAKSTGDSYLKTNPEDAPFSFEVAYLAYEVDENEYAADHFYLAAKKHYNEAESAYMLASVLALEDKPEDAINWLEHALEHGYQEQLKEAEEPADYISTDEDLESLHGLDGYEDLQERFKF